MARVVSWMEVWQRYWPGRWHFRIGDDPGFLERFRRRYWFLNLVVFISLTVPVLLIGTTSRPPPLGAAAGLIAACVWEGVAVRLRRFPFWADVLETVAIAVLAWRYPFGAGGLTVVLVFALLALGFRSMYGTVRQLVVRTVTVVAALYVGFELNPSGLSRRLPVVLVAGALACLYVAAVRVVRLQESLTSDQRVVDQLTADLAGAKGRRDIHGAMLRAVLDLLPGRTDARAIIWDEPDNLRPTAAAGARADEVQSGGGAALTAVPWVREALQSGQSTYREPYDIAEARPVLGFEPIRGAVIVVPLRHREQIRALSVSARKGIPARARAGIEHVARVGEVALGSIELTREGLEGMRERSYHDPGTRLGNRELFRQRLDEALGQGDRLVAVLLIRVDRFRAIGDSLGNIAGGDALAALHGRLESAAPPLSTIALLGSDEFGIVVRQIADVRAAEDVAARVVAGLHEPLPGLLGTGSGVFVRSSVGVAVSGSEARTATDLLRNADVAVHTASATEADSYRMFDPAMRRSILDRLELESDLKRAMERNEFELHYQPVVRLNDWERISGVEALIRWNCPGRGAVPPAKFIPVAEETGLIHPIGTWVMREACRKQRDWTATRPDIVVSINLSPMQFGQPDVASMIGDIITETGADPARIVVELTESALVEGSEANRDKLHAIKATGVRLALDDFGTGFSSLGYLRQFPFDIIKIDRSFVREVDVDEGAAAIASSVIRIAKALNLMSLAEGIDSSGQADWLAEAGCDAAQGFFFAQPIPPAQLFPLLTDGLSLSAARG